jgi:hypothetical protein
MRLARLEVVIGSILNQGKIVKFSLTLWPKSGIVGASNDTNEENDMTTTFEAIVNGEQFRIQTGRFGPSALCVKLDDDHYRFMNDLTVGPGNVGVTISRPLRRDQEVLRIVQNRP